MPSHNLPADRDRLAQKDCSARRLTSSRGVALRSVWPRQPQFLVPYPKGTSTDCIARVNTKVRRIQDKFTDIACTGIPTGKPKNGFVHEIETLGGLIAPPAGAWTQPSSPRPRSNSSRWKQLGFVSAVMPCGRHHSTWLSNPMACGNPLGISSS